MALRWTMIGAAALALAACSGSEETAESSELALQETPNLPADPAGVVRLRGDGQSADIATAEGIDLASSEAELAAAYEVEMIADSTLGEEFTTPAGIFGFLTGEGAQKEVESLHAGTNCFFR